MKIRMLPVFIRTLIVCALVAKISHSGLAPVNADEVFSDSGANASDIADTVDAFRDALGQLNPNEPVNVGSGRRQINWDAAPDSISAPNFFPGDFFNFSASPSSPRDRIFDSRNWIPIERDGRQRAGRRLCKYQCPVRRNLRVIQSRTAVLHRWTALSRKSCSLTRPTRQPQPTTHGFGMVFSDVDYANTTSIELFDVNDDSIGLYYAENYAGQANEHFSFLGISLDESRIARARITTGTTALGGA